MWTRIPMLPAVWLLPDVSHRPPTLGFSGVSLTRFLSPPLVIIVWSLLNLTCTSKVKRLYQYRLCYRRKVSVLCSRAVSPPMVQYPGGYLFNIRYVPSGTEKPEFIHQQLSAQYCNIFLYFFQQKRKKKWSYSSRLDFGKDPGSSKSNTYFLLVRQT